MSALVEGHVPSTPLRRLGRRTKHGGKGFIKLNAQSTAVLERRSLFPKKVVDPEMPRPHPAKQQHYMVGPLKSGHNSTKLGAWVTKGWWRDMPILYLQLEERKTCPPCAHETDCYANTMQHAKRYRHGPLLETCIEAQLAMLQKRFPSGFVVRLHVIGDFYSFDYIKRWVRWLYAYPALRIFGYTAWKPETTMGRIVMLLNRQMGRRWQMRFSNPGIPLRMSAVTVETAEQGDRLALFMCPAQTNASECCATCGQCWSPHQQRPIGFLRH